MPSAPSLSREGLVGGRVEYSAVLTPKGRMVADLRAMWGPDPDEESLFLDIPAAAIEPLLAHLKRYVPPRLATIEDVTAESGLLTVLGPEAPETIAEIVFDSGSRAAEVEGLAEGEFLEVREDGDRGKGGHRAQDGREGGRSGGEDLRRGRACLGPFRLRPSPHGNVGWPHRGGCNSDRYGRMGNAPGRGGPAGIRWGHG